MGQAKQRGTLEQRVAAARAKIDALRPEKLICGECHTALTDFDAMDTRNMRGIDAVFAGQCPACHGRVVTFIGEPDAITKASAAWQDMLDDEYEGQD